MAKKKFVPEIWTGDQVIEWIIKAANKLGDEHGWSKEERAKAMVVMASYGSGWNSKLP